MTVHDDERPGDDGVYRSGPAAPSRVRRGRVVAGALGLATVLGAGAYLLTTHPADRDDAGVVGVIGTLSAPPTGEPSAELTAGSALAAAPAPTATTARSQPPITSPATPAASPAEAAEVKKEIRAAREAAEKDGVPLQRPLTPRKGTVDGLSMRTETTAQGTIRITSAKGDLTGREAQLMAADGGKPVGKARCTQRLRFSDAAKPREIPTVLLCWRTSASRSVVTLAVSRNGKPSAQASVDVINRQWARLA